MKHLYILCIILCSSIALQAQKKEGKLPQKEGKELLLKKKDPNNRNSKSRNEKSTNTVQLDTKASDYKIISIEKDTTFIDTTLSIKKEYQFNYLRKDYFELLPFSNSGSVFNVLGHDFSAEKNTFSLFGARAKHIDFTTANDIKYYHVPTPLTEMFFKTTMEQGQLAQVFFTVNTKPNLNIAVSYKGLRSIGKYRHEKAEASSFKTSVNYNTKNNRYFIKAHVVIQSVANQENGGITPQGIIDYENRNEEFLDRARFDVNLIGANSKLSTKRFYINHYYNVFKKQDSLNKSTLNIGHISNLEDTKYLFNHAKVSDFFGDAFAVSTKDEVRLENFYNEGYASFYKNKIGVLTAKIGYTDYNYGYSRITNLTSGSIPNRLKSGFASYGLAYKNNFKKLSIQSNFTANLSNEEKGSFFEVKLDYLVKKDIRVSTKITTKDALPNFNYRLYQSNYKNYNWYNSDFLNTKTHFISGTIDAEKYAKISASMSTLENYTYFGLNTLDEVQPFQTNDAVTYLKINVQKEIKFLRNFALDNTLQYQKVTQNEPALFVPKYIIRSTLYYQNTFFKKNLFLQTGIIFNYFGKYKMNAYDPLLGEFYTQTTQEFGEQPRVDLFINSKIRSARIYLKAEQINTLFTGNTFYSAPNYPYRDFIIRFGFVWNFYL